jgi:DNA-binding transcriptional LysR family regulator
MENQLKAMAVFRKVVETGTFRAAAKALNLSPSVISHHVTQLETSLGTALLYRSTRKISLTNDGHRLFDASTKMIEAAQAGLDAIRSRAELPTGRLKVAVTGAVFEILLILITSSPSRKRTRRSNYRSAFLTRR